MWPICSKNSFCFLNIPNKLSWYNKPWIILLMFHACSSHAHFIVSLVQICAYYCSIFNPSQKFWKIWLKTNFNTVTNYLRNRSKNSNYIKPITIFIYLSQSDSWSLCHYQKPKCLNNYNMLINSYPHMYAWCVFICLTTFILLWNIKNKVFSKNKICFFLYNQKFNSVCN